MFKLLFSTAMMAPVLVFALSGAVSGGDTLLDTERTDIVQFASANGAQTAQCRGETLAVVFHDTLIDSHSAEAVQAAFDAPTGCETSFVRLTALMPEDADEADIASARARASELAAHIEAVVGEDAARDMPLHTELQTSHIERPIHHHAILRVERAPSGDLPSGFAATAAATATLN